MALSLRLRLTLWYGLLLALSLVAFASLVYVVLRVNLEHQVDDSLRLRAAQVARNVSPGADGRLEAADLTPGRLGPLSVDQAVGPDLYVQVLDQRAELIGSMGSQLPIDPETVVAALDGRESLVSLPLSGGRTVRVLTRSLTSNGRTIGVVQVGDTLDAVNTTLRQVRDILLIASLIVLSLAGAGGLLLGGRALAPVRRVSALARRITATADYRQRLPARRAADEVGELVATFNALIERVESSLEEQRQFLADTSHELRTPLTVIRANLGFLWRETDPETRAECLRETETEVARMSRLVTDLLLLGQGQGADFLQRETVALESVVTEILEQARAQADGRLVELGALESVQVFGDRDRLKQLLWNLAENALRYTAPGGRIEFSLGRNESWAELSVTDDGPGIAPEHLPRLFERFYRVDSARTRATGGSGLGLAIVKHIAKAHGGTVAVESSLGRGSTFRVRLPAESSQREPAVTRPSNPELTAPLQALRGAHR